MLEVVAAFTSAGVRPLYSDLQVGSLVWRYQAGTQLPSALPGHQTADARRHGARGDAVGVSEAGPPLRPARHLQPLLHHVEGVEDGLGGEAGQRAARQAALRAHGAGAGAGDPGPQQLRQQGVEPELEPGLGSNTADHTFNIYISTFRRLRS